MYVLVVRKLQTASTSPFGATMMLPVPFPNGPRDESVTGALHVLPLFTEACRPPDEGMKSTAEVDPFVETAMPPPLATNWGVLQVCATAIVAAAANATASTYVRRFSMVPPDRAKGFRNLTERLKLAGKAGRGERSGPIAIDDQIGGIHHGRDDVVSVRCCSVLAMTESLVVPA